MIGLALQAIPQKWLAEGVALVLYAAGFTFLGYHYTAKHYEAVLKDEHDKQAAVSAAAAASAAQESQKRVEAQSRIAHDASIQAESANADAANARRSADALRLRLDAYLRAGPVPANPAASAASGPAAGGVLPEVFDAMANAAGRFAAEADANRVGWDACVASYESLKK